jgi:pimeloyl-ACP methyl ester carboxylesterase
VAAIAGYEGRQILPLIDVPVLCIAGEQDATAPAAVMEKMAAKIRGARMLTMTGAGHFGWAEQPQVFNDHLSRFMEELGWLA